jgi:hypothetical protein
MKAKIERANPVARRNCERKKAQAGTPFSLHSNLPMALQTAQSNAILLLIQQAAGEMYGKEMPAQLSGTFYPESLQVQKKDDHALAEISGEVLFD